MKTSSEVLIVDDEPNVRLVFRTALESAGYTVSEASDGEAAFDLIRARREAVVLLDLRMPRLGGLELLRRLRDGAIEAPVVIVTAHGSMPDVASAIRLGAVDFLAKPVAPEALRRVVRQVEIRQLRQRTELGPYRVSAGLTWGDPGAPNVMF
ncbi:MAG: response regulator [Isosphaeraceae bacterium]